MESKFTESDGQVGYEEFKQFAQLHIVLAMKLLEADRTEEAKQVLAQAKQFAEQLENEELLGIINNFEL